MKGMPRLLPAVLVAGLAAPAAQSRITAPKEAVGCISTTTSTARSRTAPFKLLFNSLYGSAHLMALSSFRFTVIGVIGVSEGLGVQSQPETPAI